MTACVTIGNNRYQWNRHLWDMDLRLATGKLLCVLFAAF